jgi:hypothetical protein
VILNLNGDVVAELANLGAVAAAAAAISLIAEDIAPSIDEFVGLRWVDDDAKTRYLRVMREDLADVGAWVEEFGSVLDQIERDCE